MITKEEFIRRCDKQIPKQEIEKYKQCQKKMWTTLIITLAIEILLTCILYNIWEAILYITPFVAIISIVIIVINLKYKWGDFKKKYSKIAFDCLFEGFNYKFEPEYCIAKHIFNASGFGGEYDSYSGEDLLSVNIPNDDGTPSNVKLNICDLYVTRTEKYTVTVKDADGKTHTEERERTITVYNGAFGYIYFPFEFKCNMSLNIAFQGEKRIKLEDINFNKAFKTYTDNQLETLVILTPTLMNKLVAFSKKVRRFKMSMLKSGTIYFGMSRNLFKLHTGSKPTGRAFEYYYNDVSDILAMVNEIKDNNKVFKM